LSQNLLVMRPVFSCKVTLRDKLLIVVGVDEIDAIAIEIDKKLSFPVDIFFLDRAFCLNNKSL
jgi:hypothetical protein